MKAIVYRSNVNSLQEIIERNNSTFAESKIKMEFVKFKFPQAVKLATTF